MVLILGKACKVFSQAWQGLIKYSLLGSCKARRISRARCDQREFEELNEGSGPFITTQRGSKLEKSRPNPALLLEWEMFQILFSSLSILCLKSHQSILIKAATKIICLWKQDFLTFSLSVFLFLIFPWMFWWLVSFSHILQILSNSFFATILFFLKHFQHLRNESCENTSGAYLEKFGALESRFLQSLNLL